MGKIVQFKERKPGVLLARIGDVEIRKEDLEQSSAVAILTYAKCKSFPCNMQESACPEGFNVPTCPFAEKIADGELETCPHQEITEDIRMCDLFGGSGLTEDEVKEHLGQLIKEAEKTEALTRQVANGEPLSNLVEDLMLYSIEISPTNRETLREIQAAKWIGWETDQAETAI